jgi:hypothetical protein
MEKIEASGLGAEAIRLGRPDNSDQRTGTGSLMAPTPGRIYPWFLLAAVCSLLAD